MYQHMYTDSMSKMQLKQKMLTKIAADSSSGTMGNEELDNMGFISTDRFEIIFRQLVFGLRLIGIPLNPPAIKKESRLLYYWSIGLGSLSILLNVILTLYSLALTVKPKKTSEWNILINDINFSFAMLLSHVGIVFITSMRWGNLSSIFKRIEKLDFFRPDDYVKFRKICVVGSVTIFLVVILCIYIFFISTFYVICI